MILTLITWMKPQRMCPITWLGSRVHRYVIKKLKLDEECCDQLLLSDEPNSAYILHIFFFCFFWLRKLPEYYFLAQAFANLQGKLGPKNNIPEVSLTKKKQKNMNHGSPLFPSYYTCYIVILFTEESKKSFDEVNGTVAKAFVVLDASSNVIRCLALGLKSAGIVMLQKFLDSHTILCHSQQVDIILHLIIIICNCFFGVQRKTLMKHLSKIK